MNELAHALLYFAQVLALAIALRAVRRARTAAEEARKAERLAWMHTANTLVAEDRLTAMLPPDVIPFEPPPDAAPADRAERRDDGPDVIPFPFRPRLYGPPREGGAS